LSVRRGLSLVGLVGVVRGLGGLRVVPAVPAVPALLGLLGLLVLAVVPVAQAAETLVLTCHVCTRVVATGEGLPADSTVRLTLNDVSTGQQLASMSVGTDAQGGFVKTIPVDLFKHSSVESTVYKTDGSVLVVAAHNRFNAPCKDGKMLPMAGMSGSHDMAGMGGMQDHLAFTGAHTPQFLGAGFTLLAAGTILLLISKRHRAHT
jgi:xanthosine utilization system XapX-like protein